ncbi:MAG: aminotransferase class V-fold PLP-dependent enzyme [Alphaproteobacteria bacterium]|nr:aminotransferase class V-fold PLP-dependent enzyme [Alphaproteobacteria bacterium]
MTMNDDLPAGGLGRRGFLAAATLAAGASALAACSTDPSAAASWTRLTGGGGDWDDVRALFPLDREVVDMSAMLLTSHPKPVADAIARHRDGLDRNPVAYLRDNNDRLQNAARDATGRYLGIPGAQVALADSTTMAVSLVYQGLRLSPGDEVLTTDRDYYVTHEALRFASDKRGFSVRRIDHIPTLEGATADELADRIVREVRPQTKAVALTWVHSSTGLKMPIRAVADRLAPINATRAPDDRVLLCVDGVHGYGNQNETLESLGADFLMAGCHKWLFGPRGTGIIAGTADAWARLDPVIPTFLDSAAYGRWKRDEPSPPTTAAMATPGGFKAFEHLWALAEAYRLHDALGKNRVANRTAELAGALKDGLAALPNVTLRTPRSAALSAGIVSFDVIGANPWDVVEALQAKQIYASVAPYRTPYVRLTPSIRNSPDEIETVLRELRGFGAAA